jgi:hypothetical protein
MVMGRSSGVSEMAVSVKTVRLVQDVKTVSCESPRYKASGCGVDVSSQGSTRLPTDTVRESAIRLVMERSSWTTLSHGVSDG